MVDDYALYCMTNGQFEPMTSAMKDLTESIGCFRSRTISWLCSMINLWLGKTFTEMEIVMWLENVNMIHYTKARCLVVLLNSHYVTQAETALNSIGTMYLKW